MKIKLDILMRGNGENIKDRYVYVWVILVSLIKIVKKILDCFYILIFIFILNNLIND